MILDDWSIISAGDFHGLRSPEESKCELDSGIGSRITGLVYEHKTKDQGLFGITNGTRMEFNFISMPSLNIIRTDQGERIELNECSQIYNRTFPNSKKRLLTEFGENELDDPYYNLTEEQIAKRIENPENKEVEIDQTEREEWDINPKLNLRRMDCWDRFGYWFRDEDDME